MLNKLFVTRLLVSSRFAVMKEVGKVWKHGYQLCFIG